MVTGGQATTSEDVIPAGSSKVGINQIPYALPALFSSTPIIIDGWTACKASPVGAVFAVTIIQPGATATGSGHTAYAAGLKRIVIGKSSYNLPVVVSPQIIVGEQTLYKAHSRGVVFDSSTASLGIEA